MTVNRSAIYRPQTPANRPWASTSVPAGRGWRPA